MHDVPFLLMEYDAEVRRSTGYTYLAGVDEVGRGSLAGPLTAAAVVLPDRFLLPGLDDSKRLSAKRRLDLAYKVARVAVCWAVSFVSPEFIDREGLTAANMAAMLQAVANLQLKPELVLSDGWAIQGCPISNKAVIKGDRTSQSIAAASCLAKVVRDAYMSKAGEMNFPGYGWERNAGYATAEHRLALAELGITPFHRRLFLRRTLERSEEQGSLPLEGVIGG